MRNVTNRKKQTHPLLSDKAVDIAREALQELGEGGIGKHIGVAGMTATSATHRFRADMPGYPGWEWQAVLGCAPNSSYVTVSEVALVPGGQALQAPEWVPYSDRLRPGDLGPGDLMPPAPDDERIAGGELTKTGWKQAEKRWRDKFGPNTKMAAKAPLQCKTCALFVEFRQPWGVCANELSADGRVVHGTYGCGAHSETRVKDESQNTDVAYDDEKPIY